MRFTIKIMHLIVLALFILSTVPVQAAYILPHGQDGSPPAPPQEAGSENQPASIQTESLSSTCSSVKATVLSSGGYDTCAITSDSCAKCWGQNNRGQLGNGTTTDSKIPLNVLTAIGGSPLSGLKGISAGKAQHTCAVTTSGGVKCWGLNIEGQLGNGTTTESHVPVNVLTALGGPPLSGIDAVANAGSHTCALTSTGTVKCWGSNLLGQLGIGTISASSNLPVDVLVALGGFPLSGVKSIASGGAHTCALMNSGGLKCWGRNDSGQLGDGHTATQSSPVDVMDAGGVSPLSGVSAVSLGAYHTCALMNSGGVMCWGHNDDGELGNGTSGSGTISSLPVVVVNAAGGAALTGASAITSGWNHTCVMISSGIKCWGENSAGQIGDGTATMKNSAVTVLTAVGGSPLSGMTTVSGGNAHTCALTPKGVVKCWGWNDNGQLGNNTTTTSNSPVDVIGLGSYAISGRITLNGSGLAGVTVTGGGKTASTNASGDYTLTDVAAGSVTVTPSKTGYAFTPVSTTVTISNADVSGIDFAAIAYYTISGQVTLNGSGLASVTVTGGGKTASSNASGDYTLTDVAPVSVTVTPSKTFYIFTPTSQTLTLGANATGINFSAIPSGFNSQFNGSMAGWNKVTGLGWGVNSTAMVSPDLGRNTYASTVYSPSSFSNLDYSVHLMRSGCNTCATSIYVRGTGVSVFGNWTNGYQFSITRSGSYLVALNSIARLVPLQNWTASNAIVKGSGWNLLRVVAVGSNLKFYINGTLVWSGTNSSFSSGKVGIGISSNGTDGANRVYVDYATLIE